MGDTSTTWKSLTAGFAAGVVSTAVYGVGLHLIGGLLWGGALAYIVYEYYETADAAKP